jgi:hypothetical protein
MAIGLMKYLEAENPHIWLFNGKEPNGKYSVKGLSWVMRENLKKTSITKDVNLHSLRYPNFYKIQTFLPKLYMSGIYLKKSLDFIILRSN